MLDALHIGLLIHVGYFYTVIRFGDITALQKPTWCVLRHDIQCLSLKQSEPS